MKRLEFAVVTLLLQLAVCDEYFWLHNSNWDEPNNWSLGRVPCGGQNVSFAAVSCDTPYVLRPVAGSFRRRVTWMLMCMYACSLVPGAGNQASVHASACKARGVWHALPGLNSSKTIL